NRRTTTTPCQAAGAPHVPERALGETAPRALPSGLRWTGRGATIGVPGPRVRPMEAGTGGRPMAELPGKALAQELIAPSRAESRRTPMEAVIEAAGEGRLSADQQFRLIGRLWTLERMLYYVYGGWGQGLELNDFPPSVKYLFARQIYDDSTHEMLYLDAI